MHRGGFEVGVVDLVLVGLVGGRVDRPVFPAPPLVSLGWPVGVGWVRRVGVGRWWR